MKSRRAIYGLLVLVVVGILAVGGWKVYKYATMRLHEPSSQQVSERIRTLERLLMQTVGSARVEIGSDYDRAETLAKIASAFAEAGLPERTNEVAEQALKTTERIGYQGSSTFVLREVASALAKAGLSERANGVAEQVLKTIERIGDDGERNSTLSATAVDFAEAGLLEQALETAERIRNDVERAKALSRIADTIAEEIKRLKAQKD